MKKIALFCEGVTENRIISYITERYLGDEIIVDGIYPDVIEQKTNACIFTLNQRLQSQGLSLPDKKKNVPNAIKTYNTILKNLKPKNIPIYSSYNVGFKHFVEQLDVIKKGI